MMINSCTTIGSLLTTKIILWLDDGGVDVVLGVDMTDVRAMATVVAPLFGIWVDYWNNHDAKELLILKDRVKFDATKGVVPGNDKKAYGFDSWRLIFDFRQS